MQINGKEVTPADILCIAGVAEPNKTEMLQWLQAKISESEKSVKAREQMEEGYKTGSDAQWAMAAKLHPSTRGLPPMSKTDRLKESATQGRIAEKCRREVEMFKAVFEAIRNAD